jgi:hypothetical protein
MLWEYHIVPASCGLAGGGSEFGFRGLDAACYVSVEK